jgi:hypothetical protein
MLEGVIQGAAGGGSVVNRMGQSLPDLDSKELDIDDSVMVDTRVILTPL